MSGNAANRQDWMTPFEGSGIEWHESLPSPYEYQESDFAKLCAAVHEYECEVLRLRNRGSLRDTEGRTSMPAQRTTKCPSCGSPDPSLRGGSCEHTFHNPRPRRKPASGKLTAYLISRGWQRSDAPAEVVDFCGASSDTVGYCEHPGRWSRDFPHRSQLCAQHAMQAQRYIDLDRPKLPPTELELDELTDPEASWALRNTTR